ncbi:MAG TPA: hypothetical protein VJA17_03325 [Candidatus Omnitrophota bacterium]|nr:hypothetical protein [Candidatus Omnitrophota bacterium]
MKLTKFLKGMTIVTIFSVIYINLQVQIYDFAYQAKKKEKDIRRLVDHNGNVTYNILKLKSANHLGVKLLAENSNMQFMDSSNVVQLQSHILLKKEQYPAASSKTQKKLNVLASIFALRSQAEAKQ